MRLIRRRATRVARDAYFTPAEHRQEAERLALIVDDALQTDAKRTLADLIALARLHLDLAGNGNNENA